MQSNSSKAITTLSKPTTMRNKQRASGGLYTILSICLMVAIIVCGLVNETLAGKNKGEDIILYNGNIVLRGGKGKGKGGSIVVANSHQGGYEMEMMPNFDHWGAFGRR